MDHYRCWKFSNQKSTSNVVTVLVFLMRIANALRFPDTSLSSRHLSSGESYVDLCRTPEGYDGECKTLRQCWITDDDEVLLLECGRRGAENMYCCPDLTEDNVEAISPSKDNYPTRVDRPSGIGGVIDSVLRPWGAAQSTTRRSTPRPRTTTTVRVTRRPGGTSTRRPGPSSTTKRQTPQPSSRMGCGERRLKLSLDQRKPQLETFVVGGKDAEEYSWPWMVSIYMSRDGVRGRFLCGGSLITERHVLTAAHCFDTRNEQTQFSVVLGSDKINSSDISLTRRHVPVSNVKIHEAYKTKVYYHDIAILTLRRGAVFSDTVSPVCMPTSQEAKLAKASTNVTLVGWGNTAYGGKLSEHLQEAVLQVVSLQQCQDSYDNIQSEAIPDGITSHMLCAGSREGGDACQGDSGGPLVLDTGHRWIQVGIVSFGFRCGVQQYPGVYTKVSNYQNWINRVLSGS